MEIKQDVINSLKRYVDQRIPTGGFLQSVLENDLMMAFGRADIENRNSLFEIASYIYNELPASCHGSPVIVQEWLKGRQ